MFVWCSSHSQQFGNEPDAWCPIDKNEGTVKREVFLGGAPAPLGSTPEDNVNMASEQPPPAPAISVVAGRLLTIRQRWFEVCIGRCEGANVVPVLRDSGEIWFLASLGDDNGRKIRVFRHELLGFADHAARAYQYLGIAAYLRSGRYIAEGDEGRYLIDLKTAILGCDDGPIGFFLTRYADEGNRESAMTYDIALFLTNDAGGHVPTVLSRREHFEMVYTLEASSDFLSAYLLLLQSAVAPLLHGLSLLQIAISFEHEPETKRIKTAMADRALIASAPSGAR